MGVSNQYKKVCEELQACVQVAGRAPESVKLIAVSKTVGMPEIEEAFAAGACDFGENRPDCIQEKQPLLPQANWHFIGNVQSRALPVIVQHSCLIHSVYKASHLPVIDKEAEKCGKVQDILLEVNVSGEESKGGCSPKELPSLLEEAAGYEHIRVCGLMTMAPQGNLEVAKECFETLAALHAEMKAGLAEQQAQSFTELSMGMSEDWREAVAAGATIIRVGRAIFSNSFTEG